MANERLDLLNEETVRDLIDQGVSTDTIQGACDSLSPDYLSGFDGYVYVLEVERRSDAEMFYYVGSTTDILNRYDAHFKQDGAFSAPVPTDHGARMAPAAEHEYEIVAFEDVEVIHQRDETDAEFKARLRNRERERFAEIAREKDTTNVLGGR